MSLIPRTLAARMIGVLLLGLVLAQLLGVAVDILDRGRAFYRSTTLQAAEHIADIAKVLDAVRPEERAQIVRRLSNGRLAIALSPGSRLTDSVAERPYARAFDAMLRRELGPGWRVRVLLHRSRQRPGARTPFFSDGPGNVLDRYLTVRLFYPAPRGFAFVTHVQLHDGSWVMFSAQLPYEHITRLYVLLPRLLLMLAIVVALLLVAVRWVTRPMKKMAHAALALGQDLDCVPLEESGPEEIQATARALNVMQLRLQEYVRDRAAMLAALSHDLKTFITRLRLRTELLPAGRHRDQLIGDLDGMAAMVNATLEYLHGTNPDRGRAQFDVMALVESIRIDAEDMGWTVAVSGAAGEPFYGNVQELQRCLMNLVENAVKYGGQAAIRLEDRRSELTIAVCDPGPGIPPRERERVFEPFYRGQSSCGRDPGKGTGLGLHIARTIARAHGGDVILQPETPLGFCVMLRLPRAAAPTQARSGMYPR
jgi:signal transduction histidine kinase